MREGDRVLPRRPSLEVRQAIFKSSSIEADGPDDVTF